MPVASVVENAWLRARPDARHHRRHHRPEPGPRGDAHGRQVGKVVLAPADQRVDAVLPDVIVVPVKLSRAGDAEAVGPEPRRDDLCLVVQQRDPRRRALARLVLHVDSDRVALDGVDVDAVAQLGREVARADARADDHSVERLALRGAALPLAAREDDVDASSVVREALDGGAELEVDALLLDAGGQADGVPVDVAGLRAGTWSVGRAAEVRARRAQPQQHHGGRWAW
mmetsp:Transcript_39046/g.123000  ORF Transcript_39046/g.123000 Transcript_39046/m.123000 type:complete len:228 (+) Transcript_39046:490-1173(+)